MIGSMMTFQIGDRIVLDDGTWQAVPGPDGMPLGLRHTVDGTERTLMGEALPLTTAPVLRRCQVVGSMIGAHMLRSLSSHEVLLVPVAMVPMAGTVHLGDIYDVTILGGQVVGMMQVQSAAAWGAGAVPPDLMLEAGAWGVDVAMPPPNAAAAPAPEADTADEAEDLAARLDEAHRGENLVTAGDLQIPDIRKIRAATGLSQAAFAERFGLSRTALQNWEQQRRTPDRTARLIFRLIATAPEAVAKAAAADASSVRDAP